MEFEHNIAARRDATTIPQAAGGLEKIDTEVPEHLGVVGCMCKKVDLGIYQSRRKESS